MRGNIEAILVNTEGKGIDINNLDVVVHRCMVKYADDAHCKIFVL